MKSRRHVLSTMSAALIASMCVVGAANAEVGVTDTEIKIGALGVLTGPLAKYGNTVYDGIETVYEEANKSGGIHGRQLVYVREDDRCQAAEAVGAAKKLIHQHKVFMIHGGACSNASLAAKPEIVATKVPWVITASTAPSLTDPVTPHIFTTMLAGWMESYAQVQYAVEKGMKRVAIIAQHDNWGRSRYDPLLEAFKLHGLEPVADEEIVPDPADATAIALRIQAAKADAVILITFPKAAVVAVRDMYKVGYKPFLIGGSTVGDVGLFTKNVGIPGATDNLHAVSTIGYAADDPAVTKWKKLVEAKYSGDTFNIYHMFGIASGQFVVEALRKAGKDLTRDSFNKAASNLSVNTDVYGGPITCTPTNHQCHNTAAWFGLVDGTTKRLATTTVTR